MKKNRKLTYIMLLLVTAILMMGCNGTNPEVKTTYKATEEELSYALPKLGEAAILHMKVQAGAKGTIKVATVGSPNTEILQEAGRLLETKGYLLQIEVCDDYLKPNQLVEEGKVDCNFYQHQAFLERYNIEKGTNLIEMARIYYEPLAIYSEKIKSLAEVPQGAEVAVPKNPTALAQALLLLQEEGMLTLTSDADLTAVLDDIAENPKKLEIVLMEEEEILNSLRDVELAVCHTGYSLKFAMGAEEVLISTEMMDSAAAQKLSQIIVVSEYPNENAEILTEVLMSKEMQEFIEKTYQETIYRMNGKLDEIEVTGSEENEEVDEEEIADGNGKRSEEKTVKD